MHARAPAAYPLPPSLPTPSQGIRCSYPTHQPPGPPSTHLHAHKHTNTNTHKLLQQKMMSAGHFPFHVASRSRGVGGFRSEEPNLVWTVARFLMPPACVCPSIGKSFQNVMCGCQGRFCSCTERWPIAQSPRTYFGHTPSPSRRFLLDGWVSMFVIVLDDAAVRVARACGSCSFG